MSDRLSDEQVARLAGIARTMTGPANVAVMLAREVQERRAADAERDALQAKVDAWEASSPYDPLTAKRLTDAYRDRVTELEAKADAIDAHVSAYMFGGRPWSTALRHIFIILHPEGDTPT